MATPAAVDGVTDRHEVYRREDSAISGKWIIGPSWNT